MRVKFKLMATFEDWTKCFYNGMLLVILLQLSQPKCLCGCFKSFLSRSVLWLFFRLISSKLLCNSASVMYPLYLRLHWDIILRGIYGNEENACC